MKHQNLNGNEIEELDLSLIELEKMYNFKFDKNEINVVKNFDELCDLIIKKINLKNVSSCTSQQAFYKLRKSISKTNIANHTDVKIETKLEEIFPRKNRKVLIKMVDAELGFKLNILKAPDYITSSLFVAAIISFILLFFFWKAGLIGMTIVIFGFYLCDTLGNDLKIKTVKNLVEKVVMENYLSVRTETNTINKDELKDVLTMWFSENLGIEENRIKSASFI